MQFLLSTGVAYKTHTLQQLEKIALAEGYDGLELNMPPRHRSTEEATRDVAYGSVSSICAIHAPGDMYNAERFVRALDDVLALAKQLHVPLVNIHPAALSLGGRANVAQGISYIKEKEKETDITIAYEVLVRPEGLEADRREYFSEHQAYLSFEEYVSDVKEYNLAATLDTAHLGTWGIDPQMAIPVIGDNLKHVHLSDYSSKLQREHLPLGEGELDLVSFLKMLKLYTPNITVTVELHPLGTSQEVSESIRKSMEYIRKALRE